MNKTMNTRTIRPNLDIDDNLDDSILPCTADLQNDYDSDYEDCFGQFEGPQCDYDYEEYDELPPEPTVVPEPEPEALSVYELANIRRFEQEQKRRQQEAEAQREQMEIDRMQKENEEKEQTLSEWIQSHPTTEIPAPIVRNGVVIPTASLSKRWKVYCEEYVQESRAIQAEKDRIAREERLAKSALAIAESNAKLAKLEKIRQIQRTKMYKRDDVLARENTKRNAKAKLDSKKAQAEAKPIEKPAGRTLIIRREETEPVVDLIDENESETESADEEFPLLIGLANKNDLFKEKVSKPKPVKPKAVKPKTVEPQPIGRCTPPTISDFITIAVNAEKARQLADKKEEQKKVAEIEAKKTEADDETFARMMCAVRGTTKVEPVKPKPKPKREPVKRVETRAPQEHIKTRLCDSVVNQGGRCRHGTNCRFAHSFEELRFLACHYGDKCRRKNSPDAPCGFIHPNENTLTVCARLGYTITNPSRRANEPQLKKAQPQPKAQPYTAPPAPWVQKPRRRRWDVK